MKKAPLAKVPSREGHFQLESGYHTNVWLHLDGLFTDPAPLAPSVNTLAKRLRRHHVSAVCGPFIGGAFLAQLLAVKLGLKFFYTERVPRGDARGLFAAQYQFAPELKRLIRGERLAVVDEVISAGSSVRATLAAASAAGASVVVVGALLALGDTALRYLEERRIAVEALERRPFLMWQPIECPLCVAGVPLERP